VLTAISFRRYTSNSHSPSIETSLNIFTDLSDSTRQNRANFSFKLGWKLIQDFTLNFQITDTYDSEPPGEGASKNNVVVVTSIGYRFYRRLSGYTYFMGWTPVTIFWRNIIRIRHW
jgi:hypothetical protein